MTNVLNEYQHMKVDLMVVTNYRLDSQYIEEYCKYYIDTIGIDTIHLLDDYTNNTNLLNELPYIHDMICAGKIKYYQYPHMNQYEINNKFYSEHNTEFDWCCFFDSDEILQITNGSTIQQILKNEKFTNTDMLCVNWCTIGDNDYIERNEEIPFIKDYIDVYGETCNIFKVILKGGVDGLYFDTVPHNVFSDSKEITRKHICGKEVTVHENNYHIYEVDDSVAKLLHIRYKSLKEYLKRKVFGRIDFVGESTINSYSYKSLWFDTWYMEGCAWTEQKEIYVNKFMSSYES